MAEPRMNGQVGGLVGSVLMEAFQSLASRLQDSSGQGGSEPTTVRAAGAVSEGVLGRRLTGGEKKVAVPAVHYATGVALGGVRGVAAAL